MKRPSLSLLRFKYPGIPTGVVNASSNGMPRLSLSSNVPYFSPDLSAHSANVRMLALNSIIRLVRQLRACSFGVAHRQLLGKYPNSPFLRSSVCLDDGRAPMSSANASYELSHLSQTATGFTSRPPYMVQSLNVGSEHRRIMVCQTSYRGFLTLNLFLPAWRQITHSTQPFLSARIRTLSSVRSCPYLHFPPILNFLMALIIACESMIYGGVPFRSEA